MGQHALAELTDTAIIELCRQRGDRDERPFQELMARYQPMVWRLCYSYLRHPQDAEDLTQEVFFKVYRSLPQFEGRSAFKTWLHRVTVNTCQNELRHRSRRPQEAAAELETIAEITVGSQSAERAYQEKQTRELLTEALAQLDPDVSEILYMKDYEERPYHEIAARFDIGLSAAKMRVQRARLALLVQYRQLAGDR